MARFDPATGRLSTSLGGGRCNRRQYWLILGIALALGLACSRLGGMIASAMWTWAAVMTFRAMRSRLHDFGESGLWMIAFPAGFVVAEVIGSHGGKLIWDGGCSRPCCS